MGIRDMNRRRFIAQSSAAAAALTLPLPTPGEPRSAHASPSAYKYPNPGRIAIAQDSRAVLGLNNVDAAVVQRMFDDAIMRFTGITTSPAAALASVFPGLTTASKIAIKPNLINSSVPTRKELVKAVIRRLLEMLGGFPAANITMYEQHSFSANGYTTAYFGAAVKTVTDTSFPDLGYYIFCDGKNRPYSKTLHDADFLINMPVLKDHGCGMNFTLSFKNHMGTVNPGGPLGICSNGKAAMDIMADPVMVTKQKLIVMDCLYGIINGGPGGPPAISPCTITVAQDPVTTDYVGRQMINDARQAKGYATKKGDYIERSAVEPYSIGVANPAEMDIRRVDRTMSAAPPDPLPVVLSDAYPEPFSTTASFSLTLEESLPLRMSVYDVSGREIELLHFREFTAGSHVIEWTPVSLPAGLYFLTVISPRFSLSRRMVFLP